MKSSLFFIRSGGKIRRPRSVGQYRLQPTNSSNRLNVVTPTTLKVPIKVDPEWHTQHQQNATNIQSPITTTFFNVQTVRTLRFKITPRIRSAQLITYAQSYLFIPLKPAISKFSPAPNIPSHYGNQLYMLACGNMKLPLSFGQTLYLLWLTICLKVLKLDDFQLI